MFMVSKLVDFALPSNLIAVLGLLGALCLFVGWRRIGRGLLIAAVLVLAVVGWSPLGPAALLALEDRFPSIQPPQSLAGIVVLGGAVDTHITADRGQPTLNEAGERITAVAELSRRFPEARIFLSGGASHLLTDEALTESAIARDLLISLGVAPERIEMEEKSRNTWENAEQSLLATGPAPGDQWLLITSASHMPRAVALFRAVGFPIIPYPVDYRTRGIVNLRRSTMSIADGLQAADLAAHEWMGLIAYKVLGRTNELFPAP